MARATYVFRNGELVEKHLAEPLHASADAPYVIADGMAATFNHATGRLYDSKRAYERDTRRAGFLVVSPAFSGGTAQASGFIYGRRVR